VSWDSPVDSGYSVDNISPSPPGGLAATLEPGPKVKLTWDKVSDTDIKSYSIYRSASPEFVPAPGDIIGTAISPGFVDASPLRDLPSFYRVIAVDTHDNKSQPSSVASISLSDGVSLTTDPLPISFSLGQNYPNPFNPATVIRYSLPARVGPTFLSVYPVSLRVYNMLGQIVATLVDADEQPGYKSVSWDASTMPSGIYYYRLSAGTFIETRKMLVVR
jgi:hypothetical protein